MTYIQRWTTTYLFTLHYIHLAYLTNAVYNKGNHTYIIADLKPVKYSCLEIFFLYILEVCLHCLFACKFRLDFYFSLTVLDFNLALFTHSGNVCCFNHYPQVLTFFSSRWVRVLAQWHLLTTYEWTGEHFLFDFLHKTFPRGDLLATNQICYLDLHSVCPLIDWII